MSSILRTGLGSLVVLMLLLGSMQVAFAASEVTGTLSSDGSTTTAATGGSGNATPGASDGNTLTGTVVGGSDGMSALAGSVDTSTLMEMMWWLIPLSLLFAAGAGLYFYGRRT